MIAAQMSRLPDKLSAKWQGGFAWVVKTLGGRTVAAERQARWRPAWFLELERCGETLPLYFRGARSEIENGAESLAHEMRVLQVLEANDIPVPHVYGFCPEPAGIVMARSSGRANLATAESETEIEAVLDDYMRVLARMHQIDVREFEVIGLEVPATPERMRLVDLDTWERGYRRAKRRPEPVIEFLLRWLQQNVPRDPVEPSFLCCDAGQFLFDQGRVTAVIDLELACLGDPIADLGALPGRDLSEPLGDLSRGVRSYEAARGVSIDRDLIGFHSVRFGLVTPLAVAGLVARPQPGLDLIQYLSWYLVWSRGPLEYIADRLGVALDPPELPDGIDDDEAPGAPEPDAGFEAYEADRDARHQLYTRRLERFGAEIERLGTAEGSAEQLEARVAEPGAEESCDLIACLHRRVLRHEAILRPVMRELTDARMQIIR